MRTSRLRWLMFVVLAPAAMAQVPLAVPVRPWRQAMKDPIREAASALQGNRLPIADTATFFDGSLIREVASAIAVIRARAPELRRAVTYQGVNLIKVELTPDLGRRVAAIATPLDRAPPFRFWSMPLRDGVPFVGIATIDSMDRYFSAVVSELMAMGQDSEARQR